MAADGGFKEGTARHGQAALGMEWRRVIDWTTVIGIGHRFTKPSARSSEFGCANCAELCDLGARYRRYLLRDEFGPTRAERMAALRSLLEQLDVLMLRVARVAGRPPGAAV